VARMPGRRPVYRLLHVKSQHQQQQQQSLQRR